MPPLCFIRVSYFLETLSVVFNSRDRTSRGCPLCKYSVPRHDFTWSSFESLRKGLRRQVRYRRLQHPQTNLLLNRH